MAISLVILVGATAAIAQTSSFTYQGKLTDTGTVVTGNYDFQFGLWDSPSGGAQIGSTQTLSNILVSNGVFTVTLDLGAVSFPGADRFLEISARSTGSGSFTLLTPRQQVTSAPYAVRSANASSANALSTSCLGCITDTQIGSVAASKLTGSIQVSAVPGGSGNYVQNTTTQQTGTNFNISGNGSIGNNLLIDAANANAGFLSPGINLGGGGEGIASKRTSGGNQFGLDFFTGSQRRISITNGGNVGIGTTAPSFRLHIVNPGNTGLRVQTNTSGGAVASFGGNGDFQVDAVNVPGGRLTVKEAGNVGIGTASPQARLDVRGDIKLGSVGQFFAASGFENLRIIRGFIDQGGNINNGSGFAIQRTGTGSYILVFNQAFSGVPVITANCQKFGSATVNACIVTVFVFANASVSFDIFDHNNNRIDSEFSFIAIGAR